MRGDLAAALTGAVAQQSAEIAVGDMRDLRIGLARHQEPVQLPEPVLVPDRIMLGDVADMADGKEHGQQRDDRRNLYNRSAKLA